LNCHSRTIERFIVCVGTDGTVSATPTLTDRRIAMSWTEANTAEFIRLVKLANPNFDRMHGLVGLGKGSSLQSLIVLLKQKTPPLPSVVLAEVHRLLREKDAKVQKYQQAMQYLVWNYPNLDEYRYANITLKGFAFIADGEARKDRALNAMYALRRLVDDCKVAVRKASLKEPAASALFYTWFDGSRKHAPRHLDKVRRIFDTMSEALKTQTFEVVIHGTPEDPGDPVNGQSPTNVFAYVRPSENAYRVYLCPMFFNEEQAMPVFHVPGCQAGARVGITNQLNGRILTALDATLITMLHEMTHIKALGGTTDVTPDPYDEGACKKRALNDPTQATNNAENYAFFAKQILTGAFSFA